MDRYDLLEKYEKGDAAQKATAKIIRDITDRRGWRQEYDKFDDDVVLEIFESIDKLINSAGVYGEHG